MPTRWTLNGQKCVRRNVDARPDGLVDLVAALGSAHDAREAFLFAQVSVERSGVIHVLSGADYWMQWWIDGQPIYDTLIFGNRYGTLATAHSFPVNLSMGRHLLAVRVLSGSGGWAFASEAVRPTSGEFPPAFALEARNRFPVGDPAAFAGMTLLHSERSPLLLNGAMLPVPLEGMSYDDIPGIPSSMLHPGENLLTRAWSAADCAAALPALRLRVFHGVGDASRPRAHATLLGIPPSAVEIQTGPLLAQAGPDRATVTCRTTAPAHVCLDVGGQVLVSEPALFHRFDVTGLAVGARTKAELRVCARSAVEGGAPSPPHATSGVSDVDATARIPPTVVRMRRLSLRTLPAQPPFRFVVLGDVYPFDDTWSRVSEAALAADPAWVVFTGDMVLQGREDGSWDPGFFAPAAKLFSSVPFYWVGGNHDERAPLLERLLPMPEAWEWVQRIGNVDLVGIDGAGEWSEGSPRHAWLDAVLARSDAAYLFLFTHYPPWSSGPHSAPDIDGQPREAAVRTSRNTILPLALRHGVTAIFAGHDHFYERSEVPGGPTVVVTGGAGSRLYSAASRQDRNPHSVCLCCEYHYCLLEVDEERCRMTVRSLDGGCLDMKEWSPRRPKTGRHIDLEHS